jgi:hypothetical protein
MKRIFFCALWLLTALPAFGETPEAYPGFVWGTATKDFNDVEGWGTQGLAEQAIQWTTLPGDIRVKTFAAYYFRFRTENASSYNSHAPALGFELSRDFLNLGGSYEWRTYPSIRETTQNFYLYLSGYKRFDLFSPKEGQPSLFGIPVLGFPTTIWGQIFQAFSDLEGTGTLGWASQGIEWLRLPGDIVFRTLASYRWRYRTRTPTYYTAYGPAVGVELGYKTVDLGFGYSWMHYPHLQASTNDWNLYLTWYLDWDLKK